MSTGRAATNGQQPARASLRGVTIVMMKLVGGVVWHVASAYIVALTLSAVPGPVCVDYGIFAILVAPPLAGVAWLCVSACVGAWKKRLPVGWAHLLVGAVIAVLMWALDWLSSYRICSG